MNALDVLLAGLPLAGEAGGAAELLAQLAVTTAPRQVSLSLCVGHGRAQVRVRIAQPSRPFAESDPGAYVRDLAALDAMADRWGHGASSSGRVLRWVQLGNASRIGGGS